MPTTQRRSAPVSSLVAVNVNFNMGMTNYVIDFNGISMGADPNRFRFQQTGFATTGSDCSGGCETRVEGFFAGSGASCAGLTYAVNPDFAQAISGAAAFQSQGIGTGTPIPD